MENSRNYLLVTACKNEAENLPNLIESVISQKIRPVLWVIVDDGSTDETPNITKKAAEKNNWIHVIRLKEGKRDLSFHYATIVKMAFDQAIMLCEYKGIAYDYLGNLDGDLKLPSAFYEILINEFDINPNLGICSGGTAHMTSHGIVLTNLSFDEPSGGHMLIRKMCFEEVGGIPISYSIDAILKAKARIRDWQTRRFEKIRATESRDVGNAEGYWKGKIQSGKGSYYLNYHPLHVIAKSIYYTVNKPYYVGVPYLIGYFEEMIKRNKQIDDLEIKHYFWNKWKRNIFRDYR